MNNETFGITLQYAICKYYKLQNDISLERVDEGLLSGFLESNQFPRIFRGRKPIEFLSNSKKFTSQFIKRCPHNFMLDNGETFSVRSFKGSNKMFAPKVVGQSGDETFNHFFGHLSDEAISRENFKEFSLAHIEEMLPIIVDYALVSDVNCWFYLKKDSTFTYEILKRGDFPELTFEHQYFTFTRPTASDWIESNTIKYKGKTVLELQLHKNRAGYKIRLHRENFPMLLIVERIKNNSSLGDTAELAICNVFNLDPGADNDRLVNNSDEKNLKVFEKHYTTNKESLFPKKPTRYAGTEKRDRGGSSKSGVDFFLENDKTLSVKTNKSKSYKVCPPEVGQPSPRTFDQYFSGKGWYEGSMNEEKFRNLVKDKLTVSLLLAEYVKFLNECDFILWSLFLNNNDLTSKLISKSDLEDIVFNPDSILYSNDFTEKSSVTIKYGSNNFSIGEFQVHSARNSLKFRFNFNNLLAI